MKPGPIIYGPNGEQVADLRGFPMVDGAEHRANIRLMATATELLDTLHLATGWIDAHCEQGDSGEAQQARWILETIRAAIAKAAP